MRKRLESNPGSLVPIYQDVEMLTNAVHATGNGVRVLNVLRRSYGNVMQLIKNTY